MELSEHRTILLLGHLKNLIKGKKIVFLLDSWFIDKKSMHMANPSYTVASPIMIISPF